MAVEAKKRNRESAKGRVVEALCPRNKARNNATLSKDRPRPGKNATGAKTSQASQHNF
jgi:hypothetical protein